MGARSLRRHLSDHELGVIHDKGEVAPDSSLSSQEAMVLARLKAGDETAFIALVDQHNGPLMRLAMLHVGNRSIAEEVVQETWAAFLESLERFEGRASIKTWITRILLNQARKRRAKEARTVPFSSAALSDEIDGPSVDPDRFLGDGHRWMGHWRSPPARWSEMPEDVLLSRETRARVAKAIEALPPAQREVISLRDVEGCSSEEVCNALGLTDTNQRVLLHRARSRVRAELEAYLGHERTLD